MAVYSQKAMRGERKQQGREGRPPTGPGLEVCGFLLLAVWGALVGPQRRTYNGAQGLPVLPEQSWHHVGRGVAKSQDVREPVKWTVGAPWPSEARGLPVQIDST